jgi:hypothetical protein
VDKESEGLKLESGRAGSKWKVTARFNGEPVHSDTMNPATAAHRERYIKALRTKLPEVSDEDLDAELLRLADAIPTATPPAGEPAELDLKNVVRPEVFFTPEVAGLTVKVTVNAGGELVARWMTYLRWVDGRRERRDLGPYIDLPDGSRLWVHPIPGDPAMHSPSAWSESARLAWLRGSSRPDPAAVFKAVCERIAYFIDLPLDAAPGTVATLALWSMLTHCYRAWDAVPYLYVGGALGSGKSRVFEILARLVFRPMTSSNLTAPALFRTLHDQGGTVLFDEAERLKQSTPDQQEIRAMFLAGYRRGDQATRMEKVGETFRPVTFDVYAPKALACIAGLPPNLASQCIPVMMFRAGPDSPKPRHRIDADPDGWRQLRDDVHALALEHGATWLELARRADVCPTGIEAGLTNCGSPSWRWLPGWMCAAPTNC